MKLAFALALIAATFPFTIYTQASTALTALIDLTTWLLALTLIHDWRHDDRRT